MDTILETKDGPSVNAFGVDLVDTVLSRVDGMLVMIARQAASPTTTLYFNVSKPTLSDDARGNWSGWYRFHLPEHVAEAPSNERADARAPRELRIAGMDLLTVDAAGHRAQPRDGAFRVVPHGRSLLCLRPSTTGSLYLNRLVIRERQRIATASPEREQDDAEGGETTFVMEQVWEPRFRASGEKDIPAGPRDSQSVFDPDGRPFLEPTLELTSNVQAQAGHFDVTTVPTLDPTVSRLCIVSTGTVPAPGDPVPVVKVWSATVTDDGTFDFSETASPTVIDLVGSFGGQQFPLAPLANLAPSIAFTYEQDTPRASALGSPDPDETTFQDGRVVVAVPVANIEVGLDRAMAVYDFPVRANGSIPSRFDHHVPLVDGNLDDAVFHGDDSSPGFPTPAQAGEVGHLDDGLVMTGLLLGQVQPRRSPLLYTGSDGVVHLYYGGQDAPQVRAEQAWGGLVPGEPTFRVARFDTGATRSVIDLDWEDSSPSEVPRGTIRCLARRSGPTMNDTTISVTPVAEGPGEHATADQCDVVIDYGSSAPDLPTETWRAVPRGLASFLAVLNGDAVDVSSDPRLPVGAATYYDEAGTHHQVRLATDCSPTGEVPGKPGMPPFAANLTLVSRRTDLHLRAAVVGPGESSDRATITLDLGSQDAALTIRFPDVPRDVTRLPAILGGSDDNYPYEQHPTSQPVSSLATISPDGQDAILFVPARAAPADPDLLTVEVGPVGEDPARCRAVFCRGARELVLDDVARDQARLLKALEADDQWPDFGLAISPGPLAGSVVDQTTTRPMALGELTLLFDPVLATAALVADVVDGRSEAFRQGRHLDGERPPATDGQPGMLGLHAMLGTVPESGGDQYVDITENPVSVVVAGATPMWQRRQPTWQLDVDGSEAMTVPVDTTPARNLSPGIDFTFEAWVRPVSSETRTVVTYHQPTGDTGHWQPTNDYTLALRGAQSIEFGAVVDSPPGHRATYLQTGADRALFVEADFTWEFWVQPSDAPAPSGNDSPLGLAVTMRFPDEPDPYFAVGLNAQRQVVVRYTPAWQEPFQIVSEGSLPSQLDDEPQWAHVAVTVARHRTSGDAATVTILIDGTVDTTVQANLAPVPQPTLPIATIGGSGAVDASVAGRLATTRFWTVARTTGQIRGAAFGSVRQDEPGLAGLWPLDAPEHHGDRTEFPNRAGSTGRALGATLIPSHNQPWAMVDNQVMLSMAAGVGGAPIEVGSSVIRSDRWNHVAVAYRAGGGLRLGDPRLELDRPRYDFAVEEETTSFAFDDRLAVDAWIQLDQRAQGHDNTIIARWTTVDAGREFELYVDATGDLAVRIMVSTDLSQPPRILRTSGGRAWLAADGDGRFPTRHVAAELRLDTEGTGETGSELRGYYDLRLLIDREQVARATNRPDDPIKGRGLRLQVRSADTKLTVGMRDPVVQPWERLDEGDHAFFAGVVGETRVWTDVPDLDELFPELAKTPLSPTPAGLAARWAFREQRGLIAFDSVRDDTLRLSSSDLWTPVKATATQELFANGSRIWQTTIDEDVAYSTEPQFTLGRRREGGDGLQGAITDVRLWAAARTEAELSGDLYGWLRGDEGDLTAYWPFLDHDARDVTGGGNDADPTPDRSRFRESAAPIANEGPQVLDTYGGRPTNFQTTTTGRPAVGPLVAASTDRDGVTTGRLLRQYVYENPVAGLPLPFKVGDLDLTFIGQVQSDAKLIGYVEGAPPVPSENLTSPYWASPSARNRYDGTSAVRLTQAADTALTYTSSRGTTSDTSVKGSVGPTWKNSQATAFGLGVSRVIQDFVIEGKFVATTSNEFNWGSGVDNTIAGSWGTKSTDAFELIGDWESPADGLLDPSIGRRYVPANLGSALVESLVADSFVLRDARSRAMVGMLLVPNLAIPPDRNIITFPIAASMTRQGSLDGRVGFVDDDQARGGSYFKPAEAYALRERIERQAARDQAFYRQFDAEGRGQTEFSASLTGAESNLPVDFTADEIRRGLVNSYVWSANGGFHAEEETFVASTSTAYKGFFSRVNRGGFDLDSSFVMFVGMKGALSFAGGLRLDVSVGSSDRRSLAFGLNSTVQGERYLHRWVPDAEKGGDFSPRPTPGKVQTYRFMTTYEPPSEGNAEDFGKVVDRAWLDRSNDAAAVALRLADRTNPAWRVRHRVTFVERVPPEASDQPVATASGNIPAPVNLEGNAGLLRLVQDALGPGRQTPASIGRAVQAVLNPPKNADETWPQALIEQAVPWWGDFLAAARPGPTHHVEAAVQLTRIVTNTLDYVQAGYRTGVLPLALSGDPR